MNSHSNPTLTVTTHPAQPRLAWLEAPRNAPVAHSTDSTSGELVQRLMRLRSDESTLYALTRDWRFVAAGRKFSRLRGLLDEQFSEMGARLDRLAQRSCALGCWASSGDDDRPSRRRARGADHRSEAHLVGELLGRHETLITNLRAGKARAEDHFQDSETTNLLATLIANHEKDAFMLRALLWEVQNTAE